MRKALLTIWKTDYRGWFCKQGKAKDKEIADLTAWLEKHKPPAGKNTVQVSHFCFMKRDVFFSRFQRTRKFQSSR